MLYVVKDLRILITLLPDDPIGIPCGHNEGSKKI